MITPAPVGTLPTPSHPLPALLRNHNHVRNHCASLASHRTLNDFDMSAQFSPKVLKTGDLARLSKFESRRLSAVFLPAYNKMSDPRHGTIWQDGTR